MTELKVDNGTPNVHCGNTDPHERHDNSNPVRGAGWCDGVPPLEPFVELTVRASLRELFGEVDISHGQTLHLVATYGLGMLIDCVDKPDTAMVLRVRSTDGEDRVYPLVKKSEGKGFLAVTDATGF